MNTAPVTVPSLLEVERPWLGGRIVVGIGASQHASNTLKHAAAIAKAFGGHIDAVSVCHLPNITSPALGPVRWSASERAHTALQECIVSTFGSQIADSLIAYVHEGKPSAVLIELSRNADLLIIGRHSADILGRAFTDSVSATCVASAHCPVLVIPE